MKSESKLAFFFNQESKVCRGGDVQHAGLLHARRASVGPAKVNHHANTSNAIEHKTNVLKL